MKAILADTNLLLRAVQTNDRTLQSIARAAIKTLLRQGHELCVTPQNLIEFWGVSTRPSSVNGLGLGVPETWRNVARCEAFFRLLPETEAIFVEWKRLVAVHEVSGLKVHDARLVATMNVYRIHTILTFDTGDFQRYVPGIEVLHPRDLSSASPDHPQ